MHRAESLQAWRDALDSAQNEMTYARCDLCALLMRCAFHGSAASRQLAALLGQTAVYLRDSSDMSLCDAFTKASSEETFGVWQCLRVNEKEDLRQAAERVEIGLIQERVAALCAARDAFDRNYREANASVQRDGRMYASLGCLFGAALTILLL